MEESLIKRLEAAVTRLEGLSSTGGGGVTLSRGGDFSSGGNVAASDPSILAYDDLISQCVGRILTAAERIGGPVLDVTKIVAEAFAAQKELLIRIKQTQVKRETDHDPATTSCNRFMDFGLVLNLLCIVF